MFDGPFTCSRAETNEHPLCVATPTDHKSVRSIATDDGWSTCTQVAAGREVHSGRVDLLNRSCNPVLFALAEEGAAGQFQLAGGDGFVAAGDAECFAKLMFFRCGIPRHRG